MWKSIPTLLHTKAFHKPNDIESGRRHLSYLLMRRPHFPHGEPLQLQRHHRLRARVLFESLEDVESRHAQTRRVRAVYDQIPRARGFRQGSVLPFGREIAGRVHVDAFGLVGGGNRAEVTEAIKGGNGSLWVGCDSLVQGCVWVDF